MNEGLLFSAHSSVSELLIFTPPPSSIICSHITRPQLPEKETLTAA